MRNKTKLALGFGLAASLVVGSGFTVYGVHAQEAVIEETKTTTLCDDLFDVDANADKKSAAERRRIVQSNLDNALLYANNLTPSAVEVRRVNGIPVVELDGFHIVTADGNSAKRNNMTRLQLANKWAEKIKFCLAKKATVTSYVTKLKGVQKEKQVAIEEDKSVALVKPETKIPIHLITRFANRGAAVDDPVTGMLDKDLPLEPSFDSYIPKGSLVHGRVVETKKHSYKGFPDTNSVTIDFFSIELPNGQDIPIRAHVVGGENKFEPAEVSLQKDIDTTLDAGKKPVSTAEGVITGAWLGEGLPKSEAARLPRLYMDKGATFEIAPGEKLQIETTATTAISVSTPKMASSK